jgi:hypothetical protein
MVFRHLDESDERHKCLIQSFDSADWRMVTAALLISFVLRLGR